MTIHEDVMVNMKAMADKFAAAGIALELPPQSNLTLATQYIGVDLGKSLTAEIPFNRKFANPLGMFQGGFIGAAFDEVFGPLTYMAAQRPSVTIEMSTSYLRPFVASDESLILKAELVAKTRSLLVLKAEAHTKAGKLVATATSHSLISSDEHLKKV